MAFKRVGQKYKFDDQQLFKDFPDYMHRPIADWLWEVLEDRAGVIILPTYDNAQLSQEFCNVLQIEFREVFPAEWDDFIEFVLGDADRTANLIALCLQKFAIEENEAKLEYILAQGGSGYEVVKTNSEASAYEKGAYDLSDRVSKVVKEQSDAAIESNQLLEEAWRHCFSRNPDYEKVVSRCSDFLEQYLGKKYFPKDKRPQLKKFVHAFESDPEKLSYKGDTVVSPKNNITSLLKEASNIRGQHTGGQGRKPSKHEAEFVLHTTIYVWNLHQM